MFIAALFIIAHKRKQPKCPTTDEGVNKLWPTRRWNITQS